MEIIWHYTTGVHIEKILLDGRLKVSDAEKKFGIKPAIWFSKNQICEPTALKMVVENGELKRLDMEEQAKTIGLFRIGIQFTKELITWAKYKYVSKITPELYYSMENSGVRDGARPSQWYCSFKNIPDSEWISIERFDGNKWERVLPDGFKW